MDEDKKNQLIQNLTEEQRKITQEGSTEAPFSGEHNDNKNDGTYHCVVCGEPLFDSETKFNSGTGWPSFFKPINDSGVGTEEDNSMGMKRVEVHCKKCSAHLGHIFEDAPQTPTGKRYCINSGSLDFKEK